MALTFCIFDVHGTSSRVGQHTGLSHKFQLYECYFGGKPFRKRRKLSETTNPMSRFFLAKTKKRMHPPAKTPSETKCWERRVPHTLQRQEWTCCLTCFLHHFAVYSPFLKIHKLLAYGQGALQWLTKRPASKSENSEIRDLWAQRWSVQNLSENSTILHCKHNQLCLNKARAKSSVYLERMCDRNVSLPLSENQKRTYTSCSSCSKRV